MALWQVVAPDGERVIICEGYIRHELKHGSYIRAEHIVKLFPQFFVRILEDHEIPKEEPTIVEQPKEEVVIETKIAVKEEVEEKPKTSVKKKSGRPKKG